MVHGKTFSIRRFRPFQFIFFKVQLKPGGLAHTALSQTIFSLGSQYLACLPSVGASGRIHGLEGSVSSRLTHYASFSHHTTPGTPTTQLRPHQPPHTEPLQPARKKLHTCQARTPASQKKLARHSSQPARHFRHARKKLFTARKGLRLARGTTPDSQQETPACQEDTRWDSHFATHIFHRLTPHTVSHLTPHTLHCPKFTDPPHTAPYLTSHTSHLTMTASLERTLANQARTPASQEETLISLEKTPASQEEQKNSSKLCRNASLPEKLRDGARMHAVRPSFG